jgi:hypothetical protein
MNYKTVEVAVSQAVVLPRHSPRISEKNDVNISLDIRFVGRYLVFGFPRDGAG